MNDRLAEIKARWSYATPGPWRWGDWKATFGQPETERWNLERSPDHGSYPASARLRDAESVEVLPGLEDPIDLRPELEANAVAIASAPGDIGWLVGEVERLREEREAIFRRSNAVFESKDAEIARLRGLLARLEWAGQPVPGTRIGTQPQCPVCRVVELPHDRGCWLDAVLHPATPNVLEELDAAGGRLLVDKDDEP